MDHKKARFYGIWCQVIAFGLIVLSIVYMNTPWLYIFGTLGVVSGLGATVLLLWFWRCPRCGKRLPADNRIFEINACPCCGQELGLEPKEENETLPD